MDHQPIKFLFVAKDPRDTRCLQLESVLRAEGHEIAYLCPKSYEPDPTLSAKGIPVYGDPAVAESHYDPAVFIFPRPFVGPYAKQLLSRKKWVVGCSPTHHALASLSPEYSNNLLRASGWGDHIIPTVETMEDLEHLLILHAGEKNEWAAIWGPYLKVEMGIESADSLREWFADKKAQDPDFSCEITNRVICPNITAQVFSQGTPVSGPIIEDPDKYSFFHNYDDVKPSFPPLYRTLGALKYTGVVRVLYSFDDDGDPIPLRISSIPDEMFWISWADVSNYDRGIGYALLHMGRGTLKSHPIDRTASRPIIVESSHDKTRKLPPLLSESDFWYPCDVVEDHYVGPTAGFLGIVPTWNNDLRQGVSVHRALTIVARRKKNADSDSQSRPIEDAPDGTYCPGDGSAAELPSPETRSIEDVSDDSESDENRTPESASGDPENICDGSGGGDSDHLDEDQESDGCGCTGAADSDN